MPFIHYHPDPTVARPYEAIAMAGMSPCGLLRIPASSLRRSCSKKTNEIITRSRISNARLVRVNVAGSSRRSDVSRDLSKRAMGWAYSSSFVKSCLQEGHKSDCENAWGKATRDYRECGWRTSSVLAPLRVCPLHLYLRPDSSLNEVSLRCRVSQ